MLLLDYQERSKRRERSVIYEELPTREFIRAFLAPPPGLLFWVAGFGKKWEKRAFDTCGRRCNGNEERVRCAIAFRKPSAPPILAKQRALRHHFVTRLTQHQIILGCGSEKRLQSASQPTTSCFCVSLIERCVAGERVSPGQTPADETGNASKRNARAKITFPRLRRQLNLKNAAPRDRASQESGAHTLEVWPTFDFWLGTDRIRPLSKDCFLRSCCEFFKLFLLVREAGSER